MQSYKNINIIAKEGYGYIAFIFGIFLFFAFFDFCDFCQFLFFILSIFSVYFFRNPEVEAIDDSADSIISPIDGTIESIELQEDKSRVVVKIRNSIFDTHIIRSPLSAKVVDINRKYGMAVFGDMKKSKILNSICTVQVGEVKMKMRAEIFPDDVEFGAKIDEIVKHGQRVGFIYCGTIEMQLPYSTTLFIDVGEKVKSSQNIIGTYKNS